MKKTSKALEPLRRALPEKPSEPEIDEDGDQCVPGFTGDISQSPLFVTDGHLLLLASAIDPSFKIGRNEGSYAKKYATEEAIDKVWKAGEKRDDLVADFLGACDHCGSGSAVAFLRDPRGRVMVLNAHKLAFGVAAVHPDTLTVSAAPIDATCARRGQMLWFDAPLALRRSGDLVALLMPMRLTPEDFPGYDMRGERIALCEALVC